MTPPLILGRPVTITVALPPVLQAPESAAEHVRNALQLLNDMHFTGDKAAYHDADRQAVARRLERALRQLEGRGA